MFGISSYPGLPQERVNRGYRISGNAALHQSGFSHFNKERR